MKALTDFRLAKCCPFVKFTKLSCYIASCHCFGLILKTLRTFEMLARALVTAEPMTMTSHHALSTSSVKYLSDQTLAWQIYYTLSAESY